jgi:hypothetical protein
LEEVTMSTNQKRAIGEEIVTRVMREWVTVVVIVVEVVMEVVVVVATVRC